MELHDLSLSETGEASTTRCRMAPAQLDVIDLACKLSPSQSQPFTACFGTWRRLVGFLYSLTKRYSLLCICWGCDSRSRNTLCSTLGPWRSMNQGIAAMYSRSSAPRQSVPRYSTPSYARQYSAPKLTVFAVTDAAKRPNQRPPSVLFPFVQAV